MLCVVLRFVLFTISTTSKKHFEDTGSIMVIPDLEEENEEELMVSGSVLLVAADTVCISR